MVAQPFRRIKSARLCNEAIDGYMDPVEQQAMIEVAARKIEELFDILHIDHHNDHNEQCSVVRYQSRAVDITAKADAPPPSGPFDFARCARPRASRAALPHTALIAREPRHSQVIASPPIPTGLEDYSAKIATPGGSVPMSVEPHKPSADKSRSRASPLQPPRRGKPEPSGFAVPVDW